MKKRVKKILIVLLSLVALLVMGYLILGSVGIFMVFYLAGKGAGTWEDDPTNWYRAFHEVQPREVNVVHSKYWKSDHFTEEHEYFFEVVATPGWRDAFLKRSKVELVSPSAAWSFRTGGSDNLAPVWFAPDPVGKYEVWDSPGYHGSIWIDKTNGHVFFSGRQL